MSISAFLNELIEHIAPQRIIKDELRCFAYSIDASPFRLIAQAVIFVDNETELTSLFALAQRHQVQVTFRAGGTSRSGQAQTNQVLVTLTRQWQQCRIEPLGEKLHAQAGVSLQQLAQKLAPYKRQIPLQKVAVGASRVAGTLALDGFALPATPSRFVLADGTLVDKLAPSALAQLKQTHAPLLQKLVELKHQLLNNPPLLTAINRPNLLPKIAQHQLKSLLEFDDPIDTVAQLLIGSEGSLGFISSVTMSTAVVEPYSAIAYWVCENWAEADELLSQLSSSELACLTWYECEQLQAWSNLIDIPAQVSPNMTEGICLFLQVTAQDEAQLTQQIQRLNILKASGAVTASSDFTQDKSELEGFQGNQQKLKAFYGQSPAIGSIAQSLSYPGSSLGGLHERIHQLIDECGLTGFALGGDAKLNRVDLFVEMSAQQGSFASAYRSFQQGLLQFLREQAAQSVNLALDSSAVSLENLHAEALAMVLQIKQLFDPQQILKPVPFASEPSDELLAHLKPPVKVDTLIDDCNDCGCCEPSCPSQAVSLTPRQRIAAIRESHYRQQQGLGLSAEWAQGFQKRVIQQCTTTGLCGMACPATIDTGAMVLRLRARNNHRYRHLASYMVRHFASFASWLRVILRYSSAGQRLVGAQRLEGLSRRLHRIWPRIPVWLAQTPMRAKPIYARNERIEPTAGDAVVYWSTCTSQSLAGVVNGPSRSIPKAVQSVLAKAGLRVVYPQPTRGLCCGEAFRKQGQPVAAEKLQHELLDELWAVSSGGRYPVLSDASSCSNSLKQAAQQRGIALYDSASFIERFLLDRLSIVPIEEVVAVHLTCASRHLGDEASFVRVLKRITPIWRQPEDMNCCGFSGIQGFTEPEISASALASLKAQVGGCQFGISSDRSCEIGLSQYSGLTYFSLFEVLDRVSAVEKEKAPV